MAPAVKQGGDEGGKERLKWRRPPSSAPRPDCRHCQIQDPILEKVDPLPLLTPPPSMPASAPTL